MAVKEKKQTLCEQAIAEIRSIAQREKGNEAFRFPSERVLAEQLSVSRITVRNAYQALVNEGVLTSAPRGYILKKNQFEGVLTLDGFTRGLKEKEHVETSIIDVRRILPERNIMVALQCGLNDHILRITRLRSINKKPVQLEYCHLVENKFPGINDNKNFGSLYKLFEEEYGIRVIRAEQILSVIKPKSPENEYLALDKTVSTIMLMKRTSYDQRNTPVEYVELFINPEGREFYMELKR